MLKEGLRLIPLLNHICFCQTIPLTTIRKEYFSESKCQQWTKGIRASVIRTICSGTANIGKAINNIKKGGCHGKGQICMNYQWCQKKRTSPSSPKPLSGLDTSLCMPVGLVQICLAPVSPFPLLTSKLS